MTTFRLAFVLLLLAPLAAQAQDRPAVHRRGHVIQLAPIDVAGRVQAAAAIVLTRAPFEDPAPPQQTSFVREIVRAATR